LTEFLPVSPYLRWEKRAYGEEWLHGSLLVLALQSSDGFKLDVKLFALSLDLIGVVSSDGDNSSDTLGN
jgi:hypothetical protein